MLELGAQPLLDRVEAGQATDAELTAFDTATAVAGLSQAAIYIATAIAFLAWLSRVVENVPALGGGKPSVSPRASIGWWFVPFANLVKPYLIVTDVHDRLATTSPRPSHVLLIVWWLLWIAGNIASNIAVRLLFIDEPTIADLRREYAVYAVSDVLTIVAAVLAILVVRRIQTFADTRAAAGPSAAAGPNVPVPNVLAGAGAPASPQGSPWQRNPPG